MEKTTNGYHPCYWHYMLYNYDEPKDLLVRILKETQNTPEAYALYKQLKVEELIFQRANDQLAVTGNFGDVSTTIFLDDKVVRYKCHYCEDKHCKHVKPLVAFYTSIVYPEESPYYFDWRRWLGSISNTASQSNAEVSGALGLKLVKSKQGFNLKQDCSRYEQDRLKETEKLLRRTIDTGVTLEGAQGGYLLNFISKIGIPIQFRSMELYFEQDIEIRPTYKWESGEDGLFLKVIYRSKLEFIPTEPPFAIDLVSASIKRAILSERDSKILELASSLGSIPENEARAFSLELIQTGIDFPVPDTAIKIVKEKVRPEVKVTLTGSTGKKPKPKVRVEIKNPEIPNVLIKNNEDTYTQYVFDEEFEKELIETLAPIGINKHLKYQELENTSPSLLTKTLSSLNEFQMEWQNNFNLVIDEKYPVIVEEYSGNLEIDAQLDPTTNLVSFTPGLLIQGRRIDLQPHIANLLDDLEEGQEFDAFLESLPETLHMDIDSTTVLRIPSTVVIPLLKFIHDYAVNRTSIRVTRYDAESLFDLEEKLRNHVRSFKIDRGIMDTKGFFDALRMNTSLPKVEIPKTFTAHLEGYQKTGIDWLCFLSKYGFGGILADEMGAGKTRQLIGFMCVRKAEKEDAKFLVVSPVNPTQDWLNELKNTCNGIKVKLHHGSGRSQSVDDFANVDVIITTYGTFANDMVLKEMEFDATFLDEAQDVNNQQSEVYKEVVELKSRVVFASSGTPMENNLEELRAVFDLVIPGYLGTKSIFNRVYSKPIEIDQCEETLNKLRRKIGPFILRRKDGDPGVDFNIPRNEIKPVYFELEGEHLEVYEKVRVAGHVEVLRRLKQSGILKGSINALPSIVEMRKICCDLSLAADFVRGTEYVNPKLNYVVDQLNMLSQNNKKGIVFTYFSDSMEVISKHLKAAGIDHVCIDGSDSKRVRDLKKDLFRENETDHIVATLKAMNSGANLQNAHKVILYDPWYNPQKTKQAIARVYRKGLEHEMQTDELLFKNTAEIGVVQIAKRKVTLFDAVLDGDINYLVSGGVTQDDINIIFQSPAAAAGKKSATH